MPVRQITSHPLVAVVVATMVTVGLVACGGDEAKPPKDGSVSDASGDSIVGDSIVGDSVVDGASEVAQTDAESDVATIDVATDEASADGAGEDAQDAGETGDGGDDAAAQTCDIEGDCAKPSDPCMKATCVEGLCTAVARGEGAWCADGGCILTGFCKDSVCEVWEAKSCDDGNPCTADTCEPSAGVCQHVASVAAACDDDNPCTVDDACDDAGACLGGVNLCPCDSFSDCFSKEDDDVCNGTLVCDFDLAEPVCVVDPATRIVCPPAAGACDVPACDPVNGTCTTAAATAATACDDGNPCTGKSSCDGAGTCGGGQNLCPCGGDSDCVGQEDGNSCNGTLYCDKSVPPFNCKVNLATVVVCNDDGSDACKTSACDPSSGGCAKVALVDKTGCDDGDVCTKGDVCLDGGCTAGTDVCGCQTDADCGSQEDGDLCNGTLYCNLAGGECELNPATAVTCPSAADTLCLKNACVAKTGTCSATPREAATFVCDEGGPCTWVAKPKGAPLDVGLPCDDGNACTPNEVCAGGSCAATVNVCSCQEDGDCSDKEDGNLCNGTLYCEKKAAKPVCVINPQTVVVCPSGGDSACLHNGCTAPTGACAMVPLPDGVTCDADGATCTPVDQCEAGSCVADTNVCECTKDADCEDQEDGDQCNGTLYCSKVTKTCVINPGSKVVCPSVDDTFCRINACEKTSGECAMTDINLGQSCEDDNPCTASDACKAGECKAGTNICGCIDNADCAEKDDTNPCNGVLYCETKSHACVINPGTVVECQGGDDTACAQNQCDAKTGKCSLTPVNDKQPCAAGSKCEPVKLCISGLCTAGPAVACDDDNACTVDTCDDFVGCTFAPAPGASCDDGNLCTTEDTCLESVCAGAILSCDDANVCSDDLCKPAEGCVHTDNADECSDASVCTSGDACVDGACGGAAIDCDDAVACTNDACDDLGGCSHAVSDVACDDGNACSDDVCDSKAGCSHGSHEGGCDDGDACTLDDTCDQMSCAGKAMACDDDKSCTANTCAGGVCSHGPLADGAPCDDGNACTLKDSCVALSCVGGAPLLSSATYGGAGGDYWFTAIRLDDGSLIAGGQTTSAPADGADIWLARIAADDTTTWEKQIGGSGDQEVVALVGWLGGVGLIGASAGDGNDKIVVARYSSDGDEAWLQLVSGEVDSVETAKAATVNDADQLVVVGYSQSAGQPQRSWLAKFNGTGEQTSGEQIPIDGLSAQVVLDAGGGAALIGGGLKSGEDQTGWFGRVEANGSVSWNTQFKPPGAQVLSAIRRSTGDLAVVTLTAGEPDSTVRLWQLTEGGAPKQLLALPGPFIDAPWPMVARPGGAVVLAGSAQPGAIMHVHLTQVGQFGDLQWQRQIGVGKSVVAAALMPRAGGGLDIVGASQPEVGGNFDGWVAHADPWGHDTCAGSGPCATTKLGDCDDNNNCTVDDCSPIGCTHGALATGAPCDDLDRCTLSSSCKDGGCAAGQERLYVHAVQDSVHGALRGVVEVPGLGVVAAVQLTDVAGSGDDIGIYIGSEAGWHPADFEAGGPAEAIAWTGGFESLWAGEGEDTANGITRSGQSGDIAIVGASTSQAGDSLPVVIIGVGGFFVDGLDQVEPLVLESLGKGVGRDLALVDQDLPSPQRGWVLAGSASAIGGDWGGGAPPQQPILVRGGYDGTLKWQQTYGSDGSGEFAALVEKTGGGWVAAGRAQAADAVTETMLLVRVSADGALLGWHTYGTKATAVGVEKMDDGFVVLAKQEIDGKASAWLVRVDALGRRVWDRTLSSHDTALDPVLVMSGGLAWIGGGHAIGKEAISAVISRVDAGGGLVDERSLPGKTIAVPMGGTALANGDVTFVGATANDLADVEGLIARVDPWNNASCNETGACRQVEALDCEDGDLCTNDLCSPQTGCDHVANTMPCEDGFTCTAGSVCAASVCKVGATALGARQLDNGGSEQLRGVVERGDGTFVVAGESELNGVNRGLLTAVGADGKTQWSQVYVDGDATFLRDLIGLDVGDAVAVGGRPNATGEKPAGWLLRTDSKGATVWDKRFAPEKAQHLQAICASPDGGIAAVGTVTKPGGETRIWVLLTDPAGKQLGEFILDGDGDEAGWDITVEGVGYGVIGSRATVEQGEDCVLTLLDGAQVMSAPIIGGPGNQSCRTVINTVGGALVLGSTPGTGGDQDFWVVGLDSEAKLAWQKTVGTAANDELASVVQSASGRIWLIGATASNQGDGLVMEIDAGGSVLATMPFGGGEMQQLGAGVFGGDNRLTLVGSTTAGAVGGEDGWLLHTDSFGHAGCGSSGVCFGATPAGCDDDNRCTSDNCDKDSGCEHALLADGTPCAHEATCQNGSCVQPWAKALAAGFATTLIRRGDGRVLVLSQPWANLLGLGGPITERSGLQDVVALATGGDHSCALEATGAVRCWGKNQFGQLGVGVADPGTSLNVSLVESVVGATLLTAGVDHTCAAVQVGNVRCWGDNKHGQTGQPASSGDKTESATEVAGTGTVTALFAGEGHTCALFGDSGVRCWGSNAYGQFGVPSGQLDKTEKPTVIVALGASQLAVGERHTCVIKGNTIQCAGAIEAMDGLAGGALAEVSGVSGPVSIWSGPTANHACAIGGDGMLWCWGSNDKGQLGDGGSGGAQGNPTQVELPGPVEAVVCGKAHTCALLEGGDVWCWGDNAQGQLGVAGQGVHTKPFQLADQQ